MIQIKSYAKPKKTGTYGGSGSGGGSGTTINNTIINSSSDDWFYFDSSENSVHCRYSLVGNYEVAAWGLGDSSGSSGGSGDSCSCVVIDNLYSDSSISCLSANMGSTLREMIEDIVVPEIDVSAITTQIQQNFVRKPVVLYETDGTTGLLGVNANELGYNWQLEGYDFTPYQYLRCYIKMAD